MKLLPLHQQPCFNLHPASIRDPRLHELLEDLYIVYCRIAELGPSVSPMQAHRLIQVSQHLSIQILRIAYTQPLDL